MRRDRPASCLAVTVAVVSLAALSAAAQSVPTFTKEVAPIIFGHCTSCHRPGEVGPFSLLTYRDVKPRAEVINRMVQRSVMPPWKPEPGYGDAFIGARRLSDEQITTIQQWVEQGAIEGDPADLPPLPPFREGWRLGQPDLIVRMPEPLHGARRRPGRAAQLRDPDSDAGDTVCGRPGVSPGE